MNLATAIEIYAGGPNSGPTAPCPQCGPKKGKGISWGKPTSEVLKELEDIAKERAAQPKLKKKRWKKEKVEKSPSGLTRSEKSTLVRMAEKAGVHIPPVQEKEKPHVPVKLWRKGSKPVGYGAIKKSAKPTIEETIRQKRIKKQHTKYLRELVKEQLHPSAPAGETAYQKDPLKELEDVVRSWVTERGKTQTGAIAREFVQMQEKYAEELGVPEVAPGVKTSQYQKRIPTTVKSTGKTWMTREHSRKGDFKVETVYFDKAEGRTTALINALPGAKPPTVIVSPTGGRSVRPGGLLPGTLAYVDKFSKAKGAPNNHVVVAETDYDQYGNRYRTRIREFSSSKKALSMIRMRYGVKIK